MTVDISSDDLKFASHEIMQEHQLKEKIVNEEFKIWKKTVPLLYDTIHSHAVESPPLSVQWLPGYSVSENKNFITVKFLYGTNTSQHSQDYLNLGSLDLPSTLAPDFGKFSSTSDSIPIPISNNGLIQNTFKVLSSWKHPGEINRIKINDSIQKAITFDNKGKIHLYDCLSNSSESKIDFKYHKKEGYALEWINSSQFLSGANDSQIALWDINKPSTPIQLFKSHNGTVNDLSHNFNAPSIFGSVSDDYTTQIHDIRSTDPELNPAIKIESNHVQIAAAFHPDVSTLIATGGRDNIISLYDLRNTSEPVRKFYGHNESVIGIKWDSFAQPNTLVSWGLDNRVITWDLNQLDEPFTYPINEPQENSRKKQKQIEDPCLKFIHGGHTNRVNDVDIHSKIKNLLISVGDDNMIQIWKPKTLAVEEEEEEEEEQEEAEEVEDGEERIEKESEKDEKEFDGLEKKEYGSKEEQITDKNASNEDVEMKD